MRWLTADFGSTYTKLTAIEGTSPADVRIVGTSSAFTTIATNVMEGFEDALRGLAAAIGPFAHDRFLCCSSAAGGLAMVAVGLVPELTAKAARMAAESAGAKVLRTFAYELSDAECDEIFALRPDIVLLCGGTDGGNKEVIIANARLLASIDRDFSVIVAGNKSAVRDVEAVFHDSGKRFVVTQNVMPEFGRLDIEPARSCVRDIFIERIIDAKGLTKVQAMADAPIVPTPFAVLKGCELLSLGTAQTPGLGEFLAVDLGGATTDVYSLTKGEPSVDNVVIKGLPEPYAKRTVEGDLGMRYSAGFLLDIAGAEAVAATASKKGVIHTDAPLPVSCDAVRAWVGRCAAAPDTLAPANSSERAIDEALARHAIAEAVARHAGSMEKGWSPLGELYTLTGKDLSAVGSIIGIGGVLKNSAHPAAVLAGGAATPASFAAGKRLPQKPRYRLDSKYIFSAMGLLGQEEPDMALAILKKEISPLPEGTHGIAE